MKEQLEADIYCEPFPLMVVNNFYNEFELELIWKELDFYTAPNKLLPAKNYGGVVGYTNAKALLLDDIYRDRTKEKEKANFRSLKWSTIGIFLSPNNIKSTGVIRYKLPLKTSVSARAPWVRIPPLPFK